MRRLTFIAVALWIAGCSDSTDELVAEPIVSDPIKIDSAWQVVESFEVGREVYVRSLAHDAAAGSLWVGTSVGVHEVDLGNQTLRQTFTRADGLANEYVFAIQVDEQGNKWFGTNGGGVSRYREGEWKVFFPLHGLADYWVYSFAQQADGTLWIGTWAGANTLPLNSPVVEPKFTTYSKELINEWVYAIDIDSKDRVWLGTEGGVSMFDGESWRAWSHKDGLGAPNEQNLPISLNTGLGTRSRHDLSVTTQGAETYNPSYVFALHISADDTVWVGTWGGGVSRFDGEQWQHYTVKDGLAGGVVFSIAEDAEGTLWFGTNHGVSRFDGESWQSFGPAEGLLGANVYALAVVPGSEIWAGTKGG